MKTIFLVLISLSYYPLSMAQTIRKTYPTLAKNKVLDSLQTKLWDRANSWEIPNILELSFEEIGQQVQAHYDSTISRQTFQLSPYLELYQQMDKAQEANQKIGADWISAALDSLYIVRKGGKYGLAAALSQSLIVPYLYEAIGIPSEGLIAVKKDSLWGYIDYKGQIIIPLQYTEASYFINGVSPTQTADSFYIINTQGQVLAQADTALAWLEGLSYHTSFEYSSNYRYIAFYLIYNAYDEIIGSIPPFYKKPNCFACEELSTIKIWNDGIFLIDNSILLDAKGRLLNIVQKINTAVLTGELLPSSSSEEFCLTTSKYDRQGICYNIWGEPLETANDK